MTDDLLADDPEAERPTAAEREDFINERWQAMRWRALKRTDLKCERCGAEHERRVVRYLYHDPKLWQPFVIGQPIRDDYTVVSVRVFVVPTSLPWSGEEHELQVLCGGCMIHLSVEAARTRARDMKTAAGMRGQLPLIS
jgi:hypothetical protein